MDPAYSAFNPTVWGSFAGFVAVVAITIRWFRKRNPGYPREPFPAPEEK